MKVTLDTITDDANEARLTYVHGLCLAVLPGSDHVSGERLRVYRPVHGVLAARIFGKLRAEQAELETVAARAAARGLRDIVIL